MPRSKIVERNGCGSPSCDDGLFELGIGDVLLHEGRSREAIPHLESGLAAIEGYGLRDYYQECETLATAYETTNRRADALRALERCASQRPMFYSATFFPGPPFWMRLKLRLADEYRATNQVNAALHIEDELRKLLIYTDADHPLVRKLRERQQENHQVARRRTKAGALIS